MFSAIDEFQILKPGQYSLPGFQSRQAVAAPLASARMHAKHYCLDAAYHAEHADMS